MMRVRIVLALGIATAASSLGITVTDPEALVEPYVIVRTYRKASLYFCFGMNRS